MTRWIALVSVLAMAGCSDDNRRTTDASTGDSSSDGNTQDSSGDSSSMDSATETGSDASIDVCTSIPMSGGMCTAGMSCQTPGSPCGSIWTCPAGTWQEEVVCPPMQMCPETAPMDGETCMLTNPPAGELRCSYAETCPAQPITIATCNDVTWTITMEPCPG